MFILRLSIGAMLGLLAVPCPSVPAAQTLPYKGHVVVDGTNFTGAGQFEFALINRAGTVTYWSNDGSSLAGSEPDSAVPLAVTSGRFAVKLGDLALPHMTAIPAAVFTNTDLYVQCH